MEYKSAKRIFWDKTKKPLVFVLVSLAAAIGLNAAREGKDNFDRERKAPFVVYADSEPKVADTAPPVRFVKIGCLVQKIIGSDCALPNKEANAPQTNSESKTSAMKTAKNSNETDAVTTEQIIRNGIEQIQYRQFGSEDEVFDALTAEVISRRNADLRALESQRDALLRQKSVFTVAESNDLNTIASGASAATAQAEKTVDVPTLCPPPANAPKTGKNEPQNEKAPVCSILLNAKAVKDKPQERVFPLAELNAAIKAHYKIKADYADKSVGYVESQMAASGGNYQDAFRSLYAAFKSESKPALFAEAGKREYQSGFYKTVLDEKSGLNVIYLLAVITLTAVIVFALLYVILLPLKHVFFLSESAETITGRAKDFIKIREAASAGAGAKVVAAVAALGIGAAVIGTAAPLKAAGEAITGATGAAGANGAVVASANPKIVRGDNLGGDVRNDYRFGDDYTEQINGILIDIAAVKSTVGEIKVVVDGISPESGGYTYSPNIDNRTFPVSYQPDNDTITGLTTAIKENNERIGITNERIGDPTASPQVGSVLEQLSQVRADIGVASPKPDQRQSLTQQLSDINDVAADVSDRTYAIGTKADEFYEVGRLLDERTDDINGKADTINTATADTRRDVLGRDGRSFYKQMLTLFSGERYRVTPGAVEALREIIPKEQFAAKEGGTLEAALAKLTSKRAMSGGEIMKRLQEAGADEKMLKKHRKEILQLLRVARY